MNSMKPAFIFGWGLVAVALMSGSTAPAADADQKAVVLRGTYEFKSKPEVDPPLFAAQINFEVKMSGCSWVIGYTDTAVETNADLVDVSAQASCDGTNIYFLQYKSERGIKKMEGANFDFVKKKIPTAMGDIYVGVIPPPREIYLQNLWLAFASGCVLDSSHGKTKPPIFADLAVFYNPDFTCNYSWSDDGPNRQLMLITDHFVYNRSLASGQVFRTPMPPEYEHGFTNGLGYWQQTTNVGGFVVPQQVEFSEYFFAGGTATHVDVRKNYTFTCTVTNIQTMAAGRIPALPPVGRVLVADRRFVQKGYAQLVYTITNGFWVPADSPVVARRMKYTAKLSMEDEALISMGHPTHAVSRKYYVWAMMALPFVFLFGKLILDTVKNKNDKGQTTVVQP